MNRNVSVLYISLTRIITEIECKFIRSGNLNCIQGRDITEKNHNLPISDVLNPFSFASKQIFQRTP